MEDEEGGDDAKKDKEEVDLPPEVVAGPEPLGLDVAEVPEDAEVEEEHGEEREQGRHQDVEVGPVESKKFSVLDRRVLQIST